MNPIAIIAGKMPDDALAEAIKDLEAIYGEVVIGDDSSLTTRPREYRAAMDCHSAALSLATELKKRRHASDCAIHRAPAYPPGPCNCGADQ